MILGSLPRVHYWRTNEARASDEIWTPIRGCGFSGVASFFSHTVARRPPSPNSRFHPIRIPVDAPDRFPSNGIKRNPPRFRPCSGSGSSSRLSIPGTLGTQDASRSTPLNPPMRAKLDRPLEPAQMGSCPFNWVFIYVSNRQFCSAYPDAGLQTHVQECACIMVAHLPILSPLHRLQFSH